MKHLKKLLFGAFELLLFSCSTDQHESPVSDFLSINIQSPKVNYVTKAVTSTLLEDNIEHIDILIFDRNGNLIPTFGKQRFTGSEITGGKISLRTDKTISPQNFYAVANADAASINNITTLAQLKALQLTNTAGLTAPFKMVGQHEGVDVNISSPSIDIQLQRTMARIDIKLVPSISNFELINAEIRNTRNSTYLFPNTASTGNLIDIKNPIQADDSKNHTAKLYSFENNNTNLNDIANTTCVIIGGYYNGNKSKLTYYRLDVLTSDNKAKVDKGVCYTLSVTDVIGKGWDTADDAEANKANNVIYEVKEWVEQNNNIIFDGENYIALAQSKLNILRAGGNIELSIQASDLTKVITEKNGNVGINTININPSTKKVTLSINPNTSGAALKGNIIFKLGRLSYTLPLYQYAQDITTSFDSEVFFEGVGGTKNLSATLSSGWEFRSVSVTSGNNPEWLSVTPNYSTGTLSLIAPASAKSRSCNLHCTFVHNETNETRSTDILVHQNNTDIQSFYIAATSNQMFPINITGIGEYTKDQNCTLTAPDLLSIRGLKFSGWQEGNIIVSQNREYSFKVTANRTLKAIYEQPLTINTMLTAGIEKIFGAGNYDARGDFELTAIVKHGYIFDYWESKGTGESSFTKDLSSNPLLVDASYLSANKSPYTYRAIATYPHVQFISDENPASEQGCSEARVFVDGTQVDWFPLYHYREPDNFLTTVPACKSVKIDVTKNVYTYNSLKIWDSKKSKLLSLSNAATSTGSATTFFVQIPEQHCIFEFCRSSAPIPTDGATITVRVSKVSQKMVRCDLSSDQTFNQNVTITGSFEFTYRSLDDYYPDTQPTEKSNYANIQVTLPKNITSTSVDIDISKYMHGLSTEIISIDKGGASSASPSIIGTTNIRTIITK